MRVIAPPTTSLDPKPVLILRDGSVAAIRAASQADRDAVREFFHHFSPESRYRRFFSVAEPSEDVIGRLCMSADPAQGVTLLASRSVDGHERLLGMVSYFPVNSSSAEVAFAVDEQFGGQGIAMGLLERLAVRARAAGFQRFEASTLTENGPMLGVFRDSGFMIRSKSRGGEVEVELSLLQSADGVAAHDEREHIAAVASIRPLFCPASVAVVGVSRDRGKVGRRIFEALVAAGYRGPIYPVNSSTDDIAGVKAYRSVRDLPPSVDLAVIVVPHTAVLAVVDECAAVQVKAIVVITAGFAEVGGDGQALQAALLAKVRSYGMRMVGPNCMGLLNTAIGLNASLKAVPPPAGQVALSSQSGALGLAVLSLAAERGLGFSTFISVGNKADVSGNDLLQYWEDDRSTSVILLYLESFGNPRRFGRLARRIGRTKPIVAVKAGRTRAGSRAAGSHTAALTASEVAVDALFRQAGVIRADTIGEMFDVGACLDAQPLPAGRRVAIVTNAGGPGILAVDACEAAGLTVADFSDVTRQHLAEFLPRVASLHNPVDMVASAGPEEYRRCIEVVLGAAEADALIVIHAPVDSSQSASIRRAITEGVVAGRNAGATNKPVLACLMAEAGRPMPLEMGLERVPAYGFPENAARALGKVASYAAWRTQTPGLFWSFQDIHAEDVRAMCREIVERRGDDWLTAEELRRVTSAFGLPMTAGAVVRSAEEAAAVAAVTGFPVVAKLSSPDLAHKSEAGAVRLDLASADAVRAAFDDLMAIAVERGLVGPLHGVIVQPMIRDGTEVIVGLADDPLFGPLVGVGLGGANAEALGDIHFRIAPLTDHDADELLHEIRGFALLDGYRGRPRADVSALGEVLLRVSRLAEEIPEIIELDLNPVLVLPAGNGCRIVDARVKVGRRR
jgi:acetyl coenzyme A synthetase (ADP forming)-like protein